jgi:hypothetical protein
MPDRQRNHSRNRREQEAHPTKYGFARAKMGVKPSADYGAENACGNPHPRVISAKADDLGCDEPGNCSQHGPTDETDQHDASPSKEAAAKNKKADATESRNFGNHCVGILVNGSSGFWPNYPLFSHPKTLIFCMELIRIKLH